MVDAYFSQSAFTAGDDAALLATQIHECVSFPLQRTPARGRVTASQPRRLNPAPFRRPADAFQPIAEKKHRAPKITDVHRRDPRSAGARSRAQGAVRIKLERVSGGRFYWENHTGTDSQSDSAVRETEKSGSEPNLISSQQEIQNQ